MATALRSETCNSSQWVYLVLGRAFGEDNGKCSNGTGRQTFNIIPLENLSASGMIQRINDWQGKSMRKIVYLILALGLLWLAKLRL